MSEVVARIDDFGRPAWIALMVIGFIVFWPIGLAILAYIIWSGRMGCSSRYGSMEEFRDRAVSRWERKRERWEQKMQRWGDRGGTSHFRQTGNRAFDEYRADTLRRLEDEARDFQGFLDRLRMAKDKAEFDQFMADRRNNPPQPPEAPEAEKPAGA